MSYIEYYNKQRKIALLGVTNKDKVKLINDFYNNCIKTVKTVTKG